MAAAHSKKSFSGQVTARIWDQNWKQLNEKKAQLKLGMTNIEQDGQTQAFLFVAAIGMSQVVDDVR